MKIAFAADPLSGFKIAKDSTYAMMQEAAARGHELYAFGHRDMIFDGKHVMATVSRIALTGAALALNSSMKSFLSGAPVLPPPP